MSHAKPEVRHFFFKPWFANSQGYVLAIAAGVFPPRRERRNADNCAIIQVDDFGAGWLGQNFGRTIMRRASANNEDAGCDKCNF